MNGALGWIVPILGVIILLVAARQIEKPEHPWRQRQIIIAVVLVIAVIMYLNNTYIHL